jgi:hypothetical protein
VVSGLKHILRYWDVHPLLSGFQLSGKHLLAWFIWREIISGVLFNHAATVR